jgi:hypothetical protein
MFNLQTATTLVTSKAAFPVDFNDMWQWLGYSRKDHGVRSFLNCGFEETLDYEVFLNCGENLEGRPSKCFRLTAACTLQLRTG